LYFDVFQLIDTIGLFIYLAVSFCTSACNCSRRPINSYRVFVDSEFTGFTGAVDGGYDELSITGGNSA